MNTINLRDAIQSRRTYYGIDRNINISDKEIEEIVKYAATHAPSAFNSQSTRLVLLLGDHHRKLWNIVLETLRKIVKPEHFKETEDKINFCFAAGYGTVLFYEDQKVVKGLQEAFPSYADKFPQYSDHTSAIHQYAIWLMLKEQGIGASLQHYQPLIDEAVAKEWNIDSSWTLVAQMPFGNPVAEPGEKQFAPIETKVKVFK